jgi:WD40 repeat protein
MDSTLKVWDVESGVAMRTLEGHFDYVNGVAVTADGKRALSASGDKTVKVWDVESGVALATFHCDAPATCCSFASRQKIIAGDAVGRLHFLLLQERTRVKTHGAKL